LPVTPNANGTNVETTNKNFVCSSWWLTYPLYPQGLGKRVPAQETKCPPAASRSVEAFLAPGSSVSIDIPDEADVV
jgi:hypothetical protein